MERNKRNKRNNRLLYLLLALTLLAVLAFAAAKILCPARLVATQPAAAETAAPAGAAAPNPAGTAAIVCTDMAGRTVTLAAPAKRIVTLDAANCEVLFAIGAGDALVGRGEYCDYPEACLAAPIVQSGAETNLEQIIALSPDLVLMSTMAQTDEQMASLEKAGIPTAVTAANDIAGVYESIRLAGALTAHADEAEALVVNMQKAFADASAKVPADAEERTVYFEVSPLEWGLWAAGSGTFMDEMAAMLKLTNVFADVSAWAEVSEEQVIARDPDYIVTCAMYFGEGVTPDEEILSRAGWQDVSAVKNGRVYVADSNAMTRPGSRLAEAVGELYAFVYGE